jgi:hypothetical protein
MGCSTLLDDANLWTAAAKEQEIKAAVTQTAEVKQEAKTPDVPPYVAKCVRYGLALSKQKQAQDKTAKRAQATAKPSADALVLAEVKTADERQKCAQAVLDYYRKIQKANAGKVKTS